MAQALKRFALPLLAALAALVLLALAVLSPDRQQSLGEFVAAGLMKDVAVADVQEIHIVVGATQVSLRRGRDQAWQHESTQPAPSAATAQSTASAPSAASAVSAPSAPSAARAAPSASAPPAFAHASTASGPPTTAATIPWSPLVEAGLRLLRNTPPERSFDTELPEYGLAAPGLRLRLRTASTTAFEIDFGATNPIGLARYVRVRDGSGSPARLALLPADVAQTWEQIASAAADAPR